jgi:hypothetical protein
MGKCHDCDKPHDNCRHYELSWLYCLGCAVRINRENPDDPSLGVPVHPPWPLPFGPVNIPDVLRDKHREKQMAT